MGEALLGARLVLAVVFAVAGTAKLLDRPGGREAHTSFGLPPRLAAPVGWALPVGELVVAAALVLRGTAWWGGLGALGLILVFSAVIARSLLRGERPDCRCFGQLHAAPVGWSTLLRNVVLGLLATFVIGAGWSDSGPSVVGWITVLPPADRPAAVLGLVAVVLLAAVIGILARVLGNQAQLLTRLGAIEARLDEAAESVERPDVSPPDRGLPVGALAPVFGLSDLGGETHSLVSLLAPGRPVLLFFVAPDCHPCMALAPKIASWQREHTHAVTMTVVSTGSADENRAKFRGLAAAALLQAGNEVADAYGAQWTPAAVLIGPTGRVASSVSYGDIAISSLVAHAASSRGAPLMPSANGGARKGSLPLVGSGPARLGQLAPPVALPDLEGRTVDLRDYRGRDTLVVFWNPDCPHCQQLTEHLRRWEAEPPRGAPRLFVVSSGSVESNRALGFRSSVLLDESFKVANAFGADGTPCAVLVDADGRISSTVGVGARDVLALAGVVPTVDSPGTRSKGA